MVLSLKLLKNLLNKLSKIRDKQIPIGASS